MSIEPHRDLMGCSLPAVSYLAERKDAIQTNETMACDFKLILCA